MSNSVDNRVYYGLSKVLFWTFILIYICLFPHNHLFAQPSSTGTPNIYILSAYDGEVGKNGKKPPPWEASVMLHIYRFIPPDTYNLEAAVHAQKSENNLFTYSAELIQLKPVFLEKLDDIRTLFSTSSDKPFFLDDEFLSKSNWHSSVWYQFYLYIKQNNLKIFKGKETIVGTSYFYFNRTNESESKYFPQFYTAKLGDGALDYIFSKEDYKDFIDTLLKKNDKKDIDLSPGVSPQEKLQNTRLLKDLSPPYNSYMPDQDMIGAPFQIQESLIKYSSQDEALRNYIDELRNETQTQFSYFSRSIIDNTNSIFHLNSKTLPKIEGKLDRLYITSNLKENDLQYISDQIIKNLPNSYEMTNREDPFSSLKAVMILATLIFPLLIFSVLLLLYFRQKNISKSINKINNTEKMIPQPPVLPANNPSDILPQLESVMKAKLTYLTEKSLENLRCNINDLFSLLLENIFNRSTNFASEKSIAIMDNKLKAITEKLTESHQNFSTALSHITENTNKISSGVQAVASAQKNDSKLQAKRSALYMSKTEFIKHLSSTYETIKQDLNSLNESISNLTNILNNYIENTPISPTDEIPEILPPEVQEFGDDRQIRPDSSNPSYDMIIRQLIDQISDLQQSYLNVFSQRYQQIHPRFEGINTAIDKIDKLIRPTSDIPNLLLPDDGSQPAGPFYESFVPIQNAWFSIKQEFGLADTGFDDMIELIKNSPGRIVHQIEQRNESTLSDKIAGFLHDNIALPSPEPPSRAGSFRQPDIPIKLVKIVRQLFFFIKNYTGDIKIHHHSNKSSLTDQTVDDIFQEIFDLCGIKEIQVNTGGSKFDPFFHEDSGQCINSEKESIPSGRIVDIITPGYWIEWASNVLQKTLVIRSC